MLTDPITPLPEVFPKHLQDYCDHAAAAIKDNKHHDQRRALLMDFLRKAFEIEVVEIDLEHKVKAASARGRIDAFYRFVIFEVKTDLDRERADALTELQKYFESQKRPADYVAAVTDGLQFEVFDYDLETGQPKSIRSFSLEAEAPHLAYEQLDELLAAGRKIQPLSGEVVIRFGSASLTFNRSRQAIRAAFDAVKDLSEVKIKFHEWNALLAKVYGSAPDDEDLFVKHTYLTMVSRAVVTLALFHEVRRETALYRGLMNGEFFRNRNIQNLAEDDFFSWAQGTPAEAIFFEFFGNLFRRLDEFDWSKVDEDLLKTLYQGLVDPDDRQLLGEFYTPDWLAELTLEKIGYKGGTLLDPACGSGTFLFCAIRRLRAQGMKGNKLIRTALESIVGIDVHPVAALMARANILLALAAELPDYPDDVYLRVYLADTLMTGEDTKRRALVVKAGERGRDQFYIPVETLEKGRDLDGLIDKMTQFAKRGAASDEAESRAEQGFAKLLAGYTQHEVFLWRENFKVMVHVVAQKRDTIWAFILKNAYRPAYLRRQKVDVIVANPPWLSLRDIKDQAYKSKIKELTFRYKLLGKSERNLFTQIDTSSVFFAHTEHEFLRQGGTMAFVMPKSVILQAKQHLAFQKTGFAQIHDFGEVRGLFKVPACVLIRDGEAVLQDVPITHWSGDLTQSGRNLPWRNARVLLKQTASQWSPLTIDSERSPYYGQVFQGASLVPRSLWFAEPPSGQPINLKTPFLRTPRSIKTSAKKPWKKIDLRGKVEREFLFGTALSEDLLPFAIRKLRLVVLPVVEKGGHLVSLKPDDILAEGAPLASDWARIAERIWDKRRTDENQSVYDRLDYDSLLTHQNPKQRFIVLYNRSATNLTAAYITAEERERIGPLRIQGFVADFVTYRYYADSEAHALYLTGILNAPVVNDAIKPWQTQGLQGERDIARRPFEVCPIPLFDSQDGLHGQIVLASREARVKMLHWKSKIEGGAAEARSAARKIVLPELAKLDELATQLLKDRKMAQKPLKKNTDEIGSLFSVIEQFQESLR
ncbi:MAG: N-6 DNA methylase [Candidatus Sulfotelmatobacter sp.]